MQTQSPGDAPELAQLKEAMGIAFRGMDRSFAALDQAMAELGQARSDCQQAQSTLAAIFNGPGERAALRRSAYRTAVLENQDPVFLRQVLEDAWRKSDWAFDALGSLSAAGPGQPS